MKTIMLSLMAGLACVFSAYAGEEEASQSLYNWFAGGSVAYAEEADTDAYSLHLGVERGDHAVFTEVGYSEKGYAGIDKEVVPWTLNYKYERVLTGNVNWYAGVGAGVCFTDYDSSNLGDSFSSSDFCTQAFAGLSFDLNDSFEVYGGAKWMWVDLSENIDVDDSSWVYELGLRYNF